MPDSFALAYTGVLAVALVMFIVHLSFLLVLLVLAGIARLLAHLVQLPARGFHKP